MRLAETTTGPGQTQWMPSSGSIMDMPYRPGNLGELPLTRAFGQVMSIPQLAQAKADGKPDAVMVRANNLGALVAQTLLNLPADPETRAKALEDFGGMAWTQSVLSTARNFPGATGIADAVRTSLVLHFLLGIIDSDGGRVTMYSEAYQRTAKYFRGVERMMKADTQAGTAGIERLSGLGSSLGQAGSCPSDKERVNGKCVPKPNSNETAMWADHKYCDEHKDKTFPASELNLCKRCPNPAGIIGSPRNSFNYAEWYGAYLCKRPAPWEESGRRARGMTHNWVPPVQYPAPADKPSVDLSKIKETCGAGSKQERIQGVRELFNRVFNRYPNNTEVEYYASMKWCVDKGGTLAGAPTMRIEMEKIRTAIVEKRAANTTPGADSGVGNPNNFTERGTVLDAATAAVANIAGGVTDVLCGAFKTLFGEAVGGVFCAVFSAVVRFYASGIAAAAEILGTVVTSIVRFIQILATGKDEKGKNYDSGPGGRVLGALFALLSGVTEILFLMTAPIAIPLLYATDPNNKTAISDGVRELKSLAQKVSEKNPLFPLIAILAVISVVLTPTPQAIVGLIVALVPMAAIILAKILKQGNPATGQPAIPLFANIPLDSTPTTRGLIDMTEQLLKSLVILVQGIMTIQEMMDKFMTQLSAWMKNNPSQSAFFPKGDPSKTTAQNISAFVTNLKNRIQSIFNALKDIMRTGLKELTATATNLLVLVPIIILAIFEPAVSADATLKQTIDKWILDAQTAGSEQTAYADQLNRSAKDLISLLTLPEQAALLQEEARKQGITEAGTLVGQQLAQRMKAASIPQSDRERFINAARAAYGTVN